MDEYRRWLESPVLSGAQRQELAALEHDPAEREDRFYRTLAFGTAGLRGVMGMGLNRMNEFVIRQATDAFARVLLAAGTAKNGVCLCYDCRHNSRFFAEEAAHVLRCRGIPVYMFSAPRPTPELSFAVRRLGAAAGINVTASHNPKVYNGYKVYWSDGAQLPPDKADLVAAEMARIDVLAPRPVPRGAPEALTMLDERFDSEYISAVLRCAVDPDLAPQSSLRVVYTPFHGVGGAIVPQVLALLGFRDVFCVAEQMEPDGDFPTLPSPNPEEPAGFALAERLGREKNADLLVATDPDSDRVGIAVRAADGSYVPLTGNRTGALLIHYLLTAGARCGTLPDRPALIQTIVTTGLSRAIAEKNGAACFETFTGFKFMAEKVAELEREGVWHYVMAYEESYGYMIGNHARDKDGVVASMLLCEMAAWYKSRGMTLLDGLEALWAEYGCYAEKTVSVMLPGEDGMKRMARVMAALRRSPPAAFGPLRAEGMRDHLSGRDLGGAPVAPAGMDVLVWPLAGGSRLVIRPSGTEPKLKLYALARGETRAETEALADALAGAAQDLIQKL